MSWKGSGIVRRSLTAICLLIPLAASANPVMLNPSSLIAFFVVAFWAFVVEAGVVALLLTFRGIAPLRVFMGYFIANATVFFFLFQPLLMGSSNPPVLVLEALVVLIDGLVIKLLVTLDCYQSDNYQSVGWRRSTVISATGNCLSYFIGCIATRSRGKSNSDVLANKDMRFHLGAVPTSPDFAPDASWKSLREIRPWLVQFVALPIGIVTAGLVVVLWLAITPLSLAAFAITPMSFLVSFVGIVVVHELIHAAVHPLAGRSSRSILGFWPSCGMFYAHYDGELSRNRFLTILLMPLFVISIIPLLVAAVLQSSAGWVAFISSFNALLACGDVLGVALLLFQIPANATVRNQGWRTYWKEHKRVAGRLPC